MLRLSDDDQFDYDRALATATADEMALANLFQEAVNVTANPPAPLYIWMTQAISYNPEFQVRLSVLVQRLHKSSRN